VHELEAKVRNFLQVLREYIKETDARYMNGTNIRYCSYKPAGPNSCHVYIILSQEAA